MKLIKNENPESIDEVTTLLRSLYTTEDNVGASLFFMIHQLDIAVHLFQNPEDIKMLELYKAANSRLLNSPLMKLVEDNHDSV